MKLTLIPQFGTPDQPEMTIHVAGDVLTIDGIAHDFSGVTKEANPPAPYFIGPIRRVKGVIHATIIARIDSTAADDPGGPWEVKASGDVAIPAIRRAIENEVKE
jgi:hypothetical protein